MADSFSRARCREGLHCSTLLPQRPSPAGTYDPERRIASLCIGARSLNLVPYDANWPRQFDAERRLLESVLAPWLDGGIHHVGSTAVPGLAAKPIIDMIAGVRDLEEAREAFDPLIEISYLYAPHRPAEAHHFSKPSVNLFEATHGLHLTEPGSAIWRERLAFRDALRGDPDLAAEYAALKASLEVQHREDMQAYTAGKHAFVARVLAGSTR